MARKNQYIWVKNTPKKSKPKVPETEKQIITQQFNQLIEIEFKPKYIKENPPDNNFNYLVDIFSKWYRNYIYICGIYNCPDENAISPTFETKFTRLEYAQKDNFNLSYFRHTGKWWEVYQQLTLAEALKEIKNNLIFHPY